MQLKSIEITGFKSFPDKTRLSFDKPVTVIVGPNGSGKSNIADAILWVLGEQSSKALRGGKMEDVIFGGTKKRPQMGYAEVSLTLDNLEGELSLENTEITLTRRYYRSGESEYYINRKPSRLRDIAELLMDTGMGREGYSVIGQGKIAEILSAKSRDRRDIFEEAVGISRYRHRKEESERRLSQTDENLLRVSDKIAELELQVEPLREQAETARRYLLLRDELRALEIALWAARLGELHGAQGKSDADIAAANEQLRAVNAESERVYSDTETLEASRRARDSESDDVRRKMSELEGRAGEFREANAALRAKVENNTQRAESIRDEVTQRATSDDGISAQIAEREARIETVLRELAGVAQEMDARAAEKAALLAVAEDEEREHLLLLEREKNTTYELAERRAKRASLTQSTQDLTDREDSLRAEILALGDAVKLAETDAASRVAELTAAAEQCASMENVTRGLELRLTSRREKLRGAEETASKLSGELEAASSRVKMLAEMERYFEGYSSAVKLVMSESGRGTLRGVLGTVGSLVKTDEKFALAVETALGGAMQNILVQSEDDAKAAINHLKRRDAGRATFLPLSTIRGSALNERGLRDEAGFLGLAVELARYDAKHEGVYASLLGRVAVVETLDDAVRISRKYGARFKLVTSDGQVMNAGGSMTGGSAARNTGIISRASELETLKARVAELTETARNAEQTRETCAREARASEFELESARAEAREKDGERIRAQSLVESAERFVTERANALAAVRESLTQQRERLTQSAEELTALNAAIAELEASETALQTELASRGASRTRVEAEQERLTGEIGELRVKLGALEAERTELERSVEELSDIRRDLLGQRAQQLETADGLETQNVALRAEIAEWDRKLSVLREEINALKAREGAIIAEKLELEARRTSLDRLAREKSSETVRLEREVSRLTQIKAGLESEEKQIIDRLWDTYELTRGDIVTQPPDEKLDTPASKKRVTALRGEISALGNPNIGAIEEFDRVNTRYEFLSSQRDDVEKAGVELRAIIADITAQMREIFLREFGVIEAAFKETFVELFGGGEAALVLEEPEDVLSSGIEIVVQPPGKALKTLTLLSGGERAFVAIALYFAILKVRPAPFVVLDEIEAALDDANVLRFAAYMRKMSSRTQMIVISHRRGTMEEADLLIGVTMTERGISRMLSLDLEEAQVIVREGV
ncbi:MAG: chromosome segregation protein SMC [Oscillospiraceae bacterium]|nr:chromosome segregation protein SMC [Oscillospiraceae bacterium]